MLTGLVFNIQRCSLHDGPGVRTTVFLKGCPLRCLWCHNPESQSPRPELIVHPDRCVRCGACWDACPRERRDMPRVAPLLDNSHCTGCGQCVDGCPHDARQLDARRMTVQQVLAEVLRDRIFYDDSGGGVTVSGGEPLMQADFVQSLLAACRTAGIATAVDTCGDAPREQLLATAALADLFLYDITLMDERRHRQATGVSNRRILDNLQALAAVHRQIWIRVPLVPGFNDEVADLTAIARLAAVTPAVRQVHLLPYHNWGLHKRRRTDTLDRLAAVSPPSPEAVARAAEPFQTLGLDVRFGGMAERPLAPQRAEQRADHQESGKR
jgi:pyruvate formate lyase activating enzyme